VAKKFIKKFRLTHPQVGIRMAVKACSFAMNATGVQNGFTAQQRHTGGALRLPSALSSSASALLVEDSSWPGDSDCSMERLLGNIREAQKMLLTFDSEKEIREVIHQRPRGDTGPLALEQWVEINRDGRGWCERGRICGLVGKDVAVLKGNRVLHAHRSRVRLLTPRIEPVVIPKDDPEQRDRVLRWLRSKNPDVNEDGTPKLDLGDPGVGPGDDGPDGPAFPPRRRRGDDDADEDEDDEDGGTAGPFHETSEEFFYDAEDGAAVDARANEMMNILGGPIPPPPPHQDDGSPSAPPTDRRRRTNPPPLPGRRYTVQRPIHPDEHGVRDGAARDRDRRAADLPTDVEMQQATEGLPEPVMPDEDEDVVVVEEEAGLGFHSGPHAFWCAGHAEFLDEVYSAEALPRRPFPDPPKNITAKGIRKRWDDDHRETMALLSSLKLETMDLAFNAVKTMKVPPRMAIGPEWDASRLKELQSWMKWGACKAVRRTDFSDTPLTPYLWIYTRKPDGTAKSRFCVRGDVERARGDIDLESIDAPTADRMSTRIFHSVNTECEWREHFGDVPNAFLQQDPEQLDRIILLEAPKELGLSAGHCLQCLVNCYGTNDAPVA
jgi:hypothetical protein